MSQPGEAWSPDDLRRLYEENLEEIERVVSWVSRRLCLRGEELDDFRSWVHVKLIDKDYRPLRLFSGRSALATYLVTVVQNLARDYRNQRWGRWRPSAVADRLGVTAVQLEILIEREGFSLSEATEMLQRHYGVRKSRVEIADLATLLPDRESVSVEGGERVESAPAPERADQGLADASQEETLRQAQEAMSNAMQGLSSEDRLILKMHFKSGLTIAAIAAALGLRQRQLYTRRDRCVRHLSGSLAECGLEPAEVLEALEWSEATFEVDFLVEDEAPEVRPSNSMKGREKREE
jgi:RNA polymerase sigma factor for flagellar operon FliA